MKQLHKSKKNRMIAGVSGGLAEYFAIDVALVRLVWVLAVLVRGAGVLAYIILWTVLPDEDTVQDDVSSTLWSSPAADASSEEDLINKSRRQRNAGILLIALGLVFLAGQIIPHWVLARYWPLLLVLLGLYLLFKQRKEHD